MPQPAVPRGRGRRSRYELEQPPRFGFARGCLVGLALELPLLALAVFLLARWQLGAGAVGFARSIAVTAIFAGLPALLTGGGAGRLAARATVAPGRRSRGRVVGAAAIPFAVGGVGLALLAAIPLGTLPVEPGRWIGLALAGAASGGVSGATLGAWISYHDGRDRSAPAMLPPSGPDRGAPTAAEPGDPHPDRRSARARQRG